MERIAIIGLGLIGGSIGLALKQAGLRDIEIAGTARTRDTLQKARKLGVIDVDEPSPADAARGAKLVIIATPILATRAVLKEIAPVLDEGAVVTDAGQHEGKRHALGARNCCPRMRTSSAGTRWRARSRSEWTPRTRICFAARRGWSSRGRCAGGRVEHRRSPLLQACGASPPSWTPRSTTVTSPRSATCRSRSPRRCSLSRSGAPPGRSWRISLRAASRTPRAFASGSPEMAHDIVMTNRENLLHWIDRFQEELYAFARSSPRGKARASWKRSQRRSWSATTS